VNEMPMLFTPVQAAKIMNVSRSHVYSMMNKGELGSVNLGRCRRITIGQMNDFINSLTANTSLESI
jgi:excisionase family DNA binding protein